MFGSQLIWICSATWILRVWQSAQVLPTNSGSQIIRTPKLGGGVESRLTIRYIQSERNNLKRFLKTTTFLLEDFFHTYWKISIIMSIIIIIIIILDHPRSSIMFFSPTTWRGFLSQSFETTTRRLTPRFTTWQQTLRLSHYFDRR